MAGNAVIGALRVVLGADTAALEKGLKEASSRLGAFAGTVKGAGVVIGGALAGLAGGIGVAMKQTIDEADKMGKMAQSFGVSVEELSKLKHAADLSDVSVESLGKAMGRLSKSMMEVAGGTENNVSQTFKTLGIEVKNADGSLKSSSQVITEVAGKFGQMQDGAGKTAIAMNLFGRSGAELIPMLNAGAQGMRDMIAEAEQLGIVIDSKTAKSAEAFNDNLTRLGKVKDAIILKITAEMLPALQHMSNVMVGAAKNSDLMKEAASGIVSFLKGAVEAALTAGLVFQRLGAELSALWEVFQSFGDWGAMKAAWAGFTKAGEETEAKFRSLKDFIVNFWADAAADASASAADTGQKLAAPMVVASEVVKKSAAEAEAALKRILDAGKRTFEETRTPQEEFAMRMQRINEQYQAGAFGADTYARAVASAQDKLVQANPAAQMLGDALTSAFDRALDGGMKFGEILKSLAKDLTRMAANHLFKTLLFGGGVGSGSSGLLGSIFGGARAMGGPVAGGVPYLVGERGPELFVPSGPGQIVSNKDLNGSSAGGGNTYVVNAPGATKEAMALAFYEISKLRSEVPAIANASVQGGRRNRPGFFGS